MDRDSEIELLSPVEVSDPDPQASGTSVVNKRSSVRFVGAAVAVTVLTLLWLSTSGVGEADLDVAVEQEPRPSTEDDGVALVAPTVVPNVEVDSSASIAAPELKQTWPLPPVDHDPHVLGRPGARPLVVTKDTHRSVVYANVRRRPTVIDLATANQQEVIVASVRSVDLFAVEFGEVVSLELTRTNLPRTQGRAIVFAVDQTSVLPEGFPAMADPGMPPSEVVKGNEPDLGPMMGPVICIGMDNTPSAGAATRRCESLRWTEGNFGNAADRAVSLSPSEASVEVLGAAIGATKWEQSDDHFTSFTVPGDGTGQVVRVPTPQPNAVIWLVEHQIDATGS